MLKQQTNKKSSMIALLCVAGVLLLVTLLENMSLIFPKVPAILLPTSQLFTVLKKGAVYSLVAVSMNLLNGFTGLFSLGQAGFMLLGAYTYAILTVPMAAKRSGLLPVFDGGRRQVLPAGYVPEHLRRGGLRLRRGAGAGGAAGTDPGRLSWRRCSPT